MPGGFMWTDSGNGCGINFNEILLNFYTARLTDLPDLNDVV